MSKKRNKKDDNLIKLALISAIIGLILLSYHLKNHRVYTGQLSLV